MHSTDIYTYNTTVGSIRNLSLHDQDIYSVLCPNNTLSGKNIDLYAPVQSDEIGIRGHYKGTYFTHDNIYTLGLFDCLGVAFLHESGQSSLWHIADATYHTRHFLDISRKRTLQHLKNSLLTLLSSVPGSSDVVIFGGNVYSFGAYDNAVKKYHTGIYNINEILSQHHNIGNISHIPPSTRCELSGAYHNACIDNQKLIIEKYE